MRRLYVPVVSRQDTYEFYVPLQAKKWDLLPGVLFPKHPWPLTQGASHYNWFKVRLVECT